MRGLQSAVDQVQSYGRGPDTMLAHITPDESHVIDYLQGGRKTNPVTGLPEYSMFGDILKAVARAAAGIGGFMVGGPAGAAAGSAAATKLTGGSWKDALGAAAFSGIGSLGAQGLGGGGWSPFGAKAAETTGTTLGTALGDMAVPDISIAAGPQGIPGSFGEFMSAAKSAPGIAAGLGGLSAPLSNPAQAPAPQMPAPTKINLNVKPQPREYMPYQGDPLHFAEPVNGGMAPGMGHKFYSPLLPIPQYQDQMPQVQGQGQPIEGLGYFAGGRVRGYAEGGETTWYGGKPVEAPLLNDPEYRQKVYDQALGFAGGIGDVGPAMAKILSLKAARDKKGLGLFAEELADNVKKRAQKAYSEGAAAHESGDLPFKVGTKFTTAKSRELGLLPWEVMGHGVDKKGPFYYVKRGAGDDAETSMMRANHPDSETWMPFGRPTVAKANGGMIRRFAMGGPAMPGLPMPGAQGADMPGQPGGALHMPNIRAAAMAGYNAFAKGGAPHEGPVRGPGTGTSDSIPAMLSNGEHVMTAREIDALGGGNNDDGQKQTYKLRRAIKKNPGKVRAMIRGLGAA